MSKELVTLVGPVSHMDVDTTVSGSFQNGTGSIKTYKRTMFRVGNRPAGMNGTPSIKVGDVVTVIGTEGGTFAGYAVRNHTTGVDYTSPAGLMGTLSRIFLIMPLFLTGSCASMGASSAVFGAVLSSPLLAIWWWGRGYSVRMKKANAMLATLPPPPAMAV
ncbi:MAG TPA: hypothetical protein VHC69_17750 [Polyangiaceae bacterium]|nr:hypothetical protein [Polyangiaceae bacterium]